MKDPQIHLQRALAAKAARFGEGLEGAVADAQPLVLLLQGGHGWAAADAVDGRRRAEGSAAVVYAAAAAVAGAAAGGARHHGAAQLVGAAVAAVAMAGCLGGGDASREGHVLTVFSLYQNAK